MSDQQRAARYSDLFASGEGGRTDSFASGGHEQHQSDCAYCPFCTTVALVRRTHPEVLDHLAAAARELIAAAGILVEEAAAVVGPPRAPEHQASEPAEASNVRRIEAV